MIEYTAAGHSELRHPVPTLHLVNGLGVLHPFVRLLAIVIISASVTPKLHTSLADVNFIVSMLSGAVHRTGNTPVDDL